MMTWTRKVRWGEIVLASAILLATVAGVTWSCYDRSLAARRIADVAARSDPARTTYP